MKSMLTNYIKYLEKELTKKQYDKKLAEEILTSL